jgi:hypothetical protein
VTNSGLTVVGSSIGVSPGSAISGFGPGKLVGNDGHVAVHAGDSAAASAKAGVDIMFSDAMAALNENGAPASLLAAGVGDGQILFAGVYAVVAALDIAGSLVLDAQGQSDAVFIFQIPSALSLTGTVSLLNGALASNVFWAVGSSAIITKNSAMTGVVMADQSITMKSGASLNGAALAKVAAVSLDSNSIYLDGQASDALATCTGCTALFALNKGKCIAIGTSTRSSTLSADDTTQSQMTTIATADTTKETVVGTSTAPESEVPCTDKKANCHTCGDRGCAVCYNQFYLHEGVCLEVCPSGLDPKGHGNFNRKCVRCADNTDNCHRCIGSSCGLCYNAHFLHEGQCLSKCPFGLNPKGQGNFNKKCVYCAAKTANCHKCDGTTCARCYNQFYLHEGQCVAQCPSGFNPKGKGNFNRRCV